MPFALKTMNRSIVYSAFVELCCICIDSVTHRKFTSQDWQGEEQRTPHYRGHSRKKRLPVNKGYEMGVLSAKHWWCVSDFCRELAKHPHGWLVVMCLWLLLRTCKTSMMCLWLLLRTCKTSVMCLWLLWRTCKTSSLVDFWWCVCDFCWGLAKQRRCVSNGVF